MMNLHASGGTLREFFNSQAFRQGFEEARTAAPPKFDDDWSRWQVAYEVGRLIAAQASALGSALPQIGVRGRISAGGFKWLRDQYWNYRFGELDDEDD